MGNYVVGVGKPVGCGAHGGGAKTLKMLHLKCCGHR
jgi:hypothetical protein